MKYNFEQQYEHIGYLFYGLVKREGRITATDLLKLSEFVDTTWKPVASGDPALSVHLAECVHRGIRFASTNAMTTAHALESFKMYFIMHALGFGSTLRERILDSVHTLRKGFMGSPEVDKIEEDLKRLFALPAVSSN